MYRRKYNLENFVCYNKKVEQKFLQFYFDITQVGG